MALRLVFVGLGNLGLPIATRVCAATSLAGKRSAYLVDGSYETVKAAESSIEGAIAADSVAAALAASGDDRVCLMTCLPNSTVVETILSNAGSGLENVALWIDTTSGHPDTTQALATRFGFEGGSRHAVDCAVSGGPRGAAKGSLTVMAGGTEAALSAASSWLAPLSSGGGKLVHCGPLGAGHAVKSMNNGLLAVNLLAASEALSSLAARGINPGVAASAIAASSGRSWVMQQRVPDHILTGTFDYGFSLELLAKDAATAAATLSPAVRDADSILQLASDRCRAALHELPPGADHTELARLSEALSGALIRFRT